MEDDTGSKLSELESSVVGGMEVDKATEEWEGQARRRLNYKCAAPVAGQQQQSTQEFFRRGAQLSMGELNIFDTPGKTPMRGALARSLSAVATSSPQQVGTAETLSATKGFGEGGGKLDVGASDWAEEMDNEDGAADEDEMEGMAGAERSTTPTPTPTPARWATPTPVPVTPTKGSKRMAMGTPRPMWQLRPGARLLPAGYLAAALRWNRSWPP